MPNLTSILKRTFGGSEARRHYHPSDPAKVAHALEHYIEWLIDTLALDHPETITLDCRDEFVRIRSLVKGTWFDVSAIRDDTLAGIIPGKLTKISAVNSYWEFFNRFWAAAESQSAARTSERVAALKSHRLGVRPEAFEPVRGIVHVRFMPNAEDGN